MPVWRIAFLHGGGRLASAENTSAVRIWDVETKELIAQHQSGYAPRSLAVVPPGDLLVTGSSSGEDRLDFWPASPKRAAAPLTNVRWPCFSPDGLWLLIENADGSISKLESATFRCLTVISNPVSPASLSAHPDQKIESVLLGFVGASSGFVTVDCLVATGQIVRVRTWDAAACVVDREVALETAQPALWIGRFGTAVAANGQLVAAGTYAGEVFVWSTATGRLLQTFRDHSQRIHSLIFSPDSEMLASASADGCAVLRSTVDWRQLQHFDYGTPLTSSAFSPDGRLYACTCADHRVHVWSVADGKQVARLEGHDTGPHCLVFSPDGRTLATAARDATVRLWNVATGRDMGTLPVDPGVRALVFAAKGDLLAAQIWRASNSFVQVWDASTAQRSPEQMLLKAPGTAIAHWRVAGPYQQPAIKSEDLLVFRLHPSRSRPGSTGKASPLPTASSISLLRCRLLRASRGFVIICRPGLAPTLIRMPSCSSEPMVF